MARCGLWGLLLAPTLMFAGSANPLQGTSAPDIRVLTLDSSRTFACNATVDWNVLTGNGFTIVRDSLLDPANYGSGGTVDRAVQFLPSVAEINPSTLANADVVVMSLNAVPLTVCELLDLAEFVNQGGGLFTFSNNAVLRQGPTFGAVSTGQVGSGPISIDNPSSPVLNGPFGVVTGPLGSLQFHRVFDSVGPNGSSVFSTTNPVMVEFTFGQGQACLIGDEEWCTDQVVSGCTAGQLPNAARQTIFLNAFASVVPLSSFQYIENAQCIGDFYCDPASVNSRGVSATIRALGSAVAATNDLTLVAEGMPINELGFFLNGTGSGQYSPPMSDGTICLIGAGIGRYNGNAGFPGTGQVLSSGLDGIFSLTLDLANTPTPFTPTAISAGETWRFQAWFRDGASNNFTDALTIQFQ